MRLKVSLLTDNNKRIANKVYGSEVNFGNYKEVALILNDLRNFNQQVIDKAIKQMELSKSDWDAALRI
jgi:hypothetical protein